MHAIEVELECKQCLAEDGEIRYGLNKNEMSRGTRLHEYAPLQ